MLLDLWVVWNMLLTRFFSSSDLLTLCHRILAGGHPKKGWVCLASQRRSHPSGLSLEVYPLYCTPVNITSIKHRLFLEVQTYSFSRWTLNWSLFAFSHTHCPDRHALFFWLSGKVKAKIVLAEEFWALSRIAPRPPLLGPMRDGPFADKTCREASLSFYATSLPSFASRLATPFLLCTVVSCVTPFETFDLAYKSIFCHSWTSCMHAGLYHVYTARWNVCTITFQTDRV